MLQQFDFEALLDFLQKTAWRVSHEVFPVVIACTSTRDGRVQQPRDRKAHLSERSYDPHRIFAKQQAPARTRDRLSDDGMREPVHFAPNSAAREPESEQNVDYSPSGSDGAV